MRAIIVLRNPITNKYLSDQTKYPMAEEWSSDIATAKELDIHTGSLNEDILETLNTTIDYVEIVTMYTSN